MEVGLWSQKVCAQTPPQASPPGIVTRLLASLSPAFPSMRWIQTAAAVRVPSVSRELSLSHRLPCLSPSCQSGLSMTFLVNVFSNISFQGQRVRVNVLVSIVVRL